MNNREYLFLGIHKELQDWSSPLLEILPSKEKKKIKEKLINLGFEDYKPKVYLSNQPGIDLLKFEEKES
jgi:hypothetical protein